MDPVSPLAYRQRGESLGLLTGVYTGQGFEAYYYDVNGNLIQHCATGFNTGRHNMYYGYFDQPVATESVYPGTNWPTVYTRHAYDGVGRLSSTTVMLGSELPANKWRATVSRTYNSIGQLAKLRLGNATRSFTYDANGWLKSSLTKAGGEQCSEMLLYADGATPCYNGNISAKVTSAGRYDYAYDKSNRLTAAKFSGGSGNADFSTAYSYDSRSNVTSLTRKGIIDKVGERDVFGLLDDLTFTYTGNQATIVDASTEALPFYGMTGVGLDQYGMKIRYDASGRICSDETRAITLIEYDNDGHPIRTVFDTGNEQIDTWDGFGNHLSTEFFGSDSNGNPYLTRRYYGDGHILTTSALDGNSSLITGFDGGYFDSNGVHYFITDYQGNNVAVVDSINGFTEEYNYYPYGEPWRESEGNPFTFSGNERLRLDGLNEYDFHARRYLASRPAFTSWDPLNEKYPWLSPYAYCAANPIRFIDPDGLSTRVIRLSDTKYKVIGGDLEDKDRGIYVYSLDSRGDHTIKEECIGISSSTTSFYNSDGKEWSDAIIDTKDQSGDKFLSHIFKSNLSLDEYMFNATNGSIYDFKVTNGKLGKKYPRSKYYRGMQIGETDNGQKIFSSARDIGNIAAGYVAATNGLPWSVARLGFDGYQSITSDRPNIEGISTRNAEYYGWRIGYNNSAPNQKMNNLFKSTYNLIKQLIGL